MKHKTVLSCIFLACSFYLFGQDAEKKLNKHMLMPLMRLEASPQSGKVELNAPWFYWSPVVKEKLGNNTYVFDSNYLYQGRVSRDSLFQDTSTITSDVREWCLFNPHQKLANGKWYWQYTSIHKTSGNKQWSDPIPFSIDGNERAFVTPHYKAIKQNIGTDHPRIYCSKSDVGQLHFPEENNTQFFEKMQRLIGAPLPETLLYNNMSVLEKKKKDLKPKDYQRFLGKRTKEKYHIEAKLFDNLIKAWLITADEQYKTEVFRRYYNLKNEYQKIIDAGAYNDFTEGFFVNISTHMFDVFYDHLNQTERQEIIDFLTDFQKHSFEHILHRGEHFAIDNHLWQHHFRNFFMTSLALINHCSEADKWAQYVYEVWSMRAPVGSRNDGAWVPDNGYFDANKESLITFPVILSRLTGVNYFDHPWYQNAPAYHTYTSPIGHITGGFGDNADIKRENNLDFVRALTAITNNPYGAFYSALANTTKGKDAGSALSSMNLLEDGNLYWFSVQHIQKQKQSPTKHIDRTRAKCFPDAGMVAMHSKLEHPDKNLMVAFRSSPYGLTGHAHACQNAFNIQYGGEPLFYKTGYYSSFIDPHSILSYRHSRAHNTILANGIGQTMTPSSYGWIARFMTGDKISYALGDASNAYSGQLLRDYYATQFEKWNIEITPENGFGSPGVERFRRHICLIDDNIIVIYDELEASEAVNWSWLIHSRDTLSTNANFFDTENQTGKGRCQLFSTSPIEPAVRDNFFSPAIDWLGNGAKRGITYTNHWHGEARSEKQDQFRFLAIIQVVSKEKDYLHLEQLEKGKWEINGWTIQAELNTDQTPALIISKPGNGCLHFGSGPVFFGGQTINRKAKGSTILIEPSGNGLNIDETIDKLPGAAIFY
jgi:hypothetical protein